MADVKWIKIVVDIFDDEKILLIEAMPEADSLITIWFKLLCLAGKQNNSGVFMLNDRIPYTDEMFATIFRRKLNTVRLALSTFENLGMIEIINGAVTIPNWGKHQNLERLEAEREYQRNYHREYRARQKLLAAGEDAERKGLRKGLHKADVKPIDIDKEEEVEKEEDKSTKRKRFTPPTLEEVQAYCKERKNNVDAKKFFDYYQEGEWHDSQGKPVRNWKQKLLRWEKDDTRRQTQKKKPMDERELHEEDYEHGYYSDIMNRPLRQTN